jgi:hypothetical protein
MFPSGGWDYNILGVAFAFVLSQPFVFGSALFIGVMLSAPRVLGFLISVGK